MSSAAPEVRRIIKVLSGKLSNCKDDMSAKQVNISSIDSM